jgi:hypothetical protein
MLSLRTTILFCLLLFPGLGFSSSMSCYQAHRLPGWIRQSLQSADLEKIKLIKISRFNNEKEGYYLLQSLPQGGTHLGLGGDFNYTLMGAAKSSGGVIYDIDANAIVYHQMMRAGFLMAEKRSQFIDVFRQIEKDGTNSPSFRRLKSHLSPELTDTQIIQFIRNSQITEYLENAMLDADPSGAHYTYLGDAAKFLHVRELFRKDRIRFALSNQYEPHAFRDLQQKFGLEAFRTFYVSNALEFRWLNVIKDEMSAFVSSLAMMAGEPRDLPKYFDTVETSLKPGFHEAESEGNPLNSLSALRMQLGVVERATPAWRQFWQNMKEVSWDEEAVMLSTSRDLPLWRSIEKKVTTNIGKTPAYEWVYVTIPQKLWFTSEMSQASAQYYQQMKGRMNHLIDRMLSLLPPDLAEEYGPLLRAEGPF